MSASATYSLSGSAAERYERNMVGASFAPFAGGLLEHAALREGEQVLDAACGTGIVARLAWPRVAPSGRVLGLDVNGAMLEVARRIEDAERIEWREADAAAMPFDKGSFDAVLCHHGLQYFKDRVSALAEMRRVLRPTGRLALSVWRPVAFNPGHEVFAETTQGLSEYEDDHGLALPMQAWIVTGKA